jgi:hypothetical protein
MLGLQSGRYQQDPEYRDAVDFVLELAPAGKRAPTIYAASTGATLL